MDAILGALGARDSGPRVALVLRMKPYDAWLKRGKVCVYEELYPSSFHERFEKLHSKMNTLASFCSQRPLFILKK